jgi:hypothetical protein
LELCAHKRVEVIDLAKIRPGRGFGCKIIHYNWFNRFADDELVALSLF